MGDHTQVTKADAEAVAQRFRLMEAMQSKGQTWGDANNSVSSFVEGMADLAAGASKDLQKKAQESAVNKVKWARHNDTYSLALENVVHGFNTKEAQALDDLSNSVRRDAVQPLKQSITMCASKLQDLKSTSEDMRKENKDFADASSSALWESQHCSSSEDPAVKQLKHCTAVADERHLHNCMSKVCKDYLLEVEMIDGQHIAASKIALQNALKAKKAYLTRMLQEVDASLQLVDSVDKEEAWQVGLKSDPILEQASQWPTDIGPDLSNTVTSICSPSGPMDSSTLRVGHVKRAGRMVSFSWHACVLWVTRNGWMHVFDEDDDNEPSSSLNLQKPFKLEAVGGYPDGLELTPLKQHASFLGFGPMNSWTFFCGTRENMAAWMAAFLQFSATIPNSEGVLQQSSAPVQDRKQEQPASAPSPSCSMPENQTSSNQSASRLPSANESSPTVNESGRQAEEPDCASSPESKVHGKESPDTGQPENLSEQRPSIAGGEVEHDQHHSPEFRESSETSLPSHSSEKIAQSEEV